MTEDLPTKTVDILFTVAKGDKHREQYNVAGDVAQQIIKRLETSYVAGKAIAVLHKPFLSFSDLDGNHHIIAIVDIRKIKVYTKAAAQA